MLRKRVIFGLEVDNFRLNMSSDRSSCIRHQRRQSAVLHQRETRHPVFTLDACFVHFKSLDEYKLLKIYHIQLNQVLINYTWLN